MPETTTPALTPAQPAALAARVLWEHAETIDARQAEAIRKLLMWARHYRQQQEQRRLGGWVGGTDTVFEAGEVRG